VGITCTKTTAIREQLPCKREPGNRKDPFAVAVVRSHVTVGHVPKVHLSKADSADGAVSHPSLP